MKKANFTISFDSTSDLKVVVDSIIPEIKHKIPKTNVNISTSGKKLFLEVVSEDISSLRASINSYLRWIQTALNVKKTL